MVQQSTGQASAILEKAGVAERRGGEGEPSHGTGAHGVQGRAGEAAESGESGSGMDLTQTTVGTGETTHFPVQPGGHGRGHELTSLGAQVGHLSALPHALHPTPDDTAI